ncbi:cytochrome b5 heme-binding domain-containing protein [Haematococcus lacustris]|uniref:Cytochrome b5 heme-binding domain-containing protein n=1 Tax=Haematococcus lacustris TaxID=44745 RepID=A0A699ZWJ1_HAELA|nr:cytochrome b5 heme-binding domain-containing protein [Haematococcus lacustris]
MVEEKPLYTVEDLSKHTSDKSCWLAIRGKVYDVTEFLEEHPGGYDIILTSTGTRAVRVVAQPTAWPSAWYLQGRLKRPQLPVRNPSPGPRRSEEDEAAVKKRAEKEAAVPPPKPVSSTMRTVNVLLPVALLAVAVGLNYYLSTRPASS